MRRADRVRAARRPRQPLLPGLPVPALRPADFASRLTELVPMSYRAFKRLLGETSLERKCRFLFGAGILVLITVSFWIYAAQTEHLAYEQTITTCRFLVTPIFE